ncbi:MAG: MarR family winged helix-turn-helix transcriptional regulator, partial [Paracoccaceae bacterium]
AVSAEIAALYGARFGLTIAEWRVLAHLSQEPAVGVREIHARVALDKPKITRAAQRLAAAGLVTKAPGSDRRLISLTLTPAGHALMAELVPLALAAEAEALDALTPDEAATFRGLVEKLFAARA